jgi:hypothetical protein
MHIWFRWGIPRERNYFEDSDVDGMLLGNGSLRYRIGGNRVN